MTTWISVTKPVVCTVHLNEAHTKTSTDLWNKWKT